MKKTVLAAMLMTLTTVMSVPATAGVNVSVGISLPPLIVFEQAPEVMVMPDTTGVYVVPDIDEEMFFWNGWWWRFWDGRWYRSQSYSRGWVYYRSVPSFYYDVDPGWRVSYRDRNWYGHQWNYKRIPHRQLQQNWKSWDRNRYWERQGSWGVQSYRPRPTRQRQELRQQRQIQYRQRPEVQRYQQQRQERQTGPQHRPEQQRVIQQRQEQQHAPRYEQQRAPQQRYEQPRVQQQESQERYQQGRPETQQQRQPQTQPQQYQQRVQQPEREQQQHSQPGGHRQQGESEQQRHEGRSERDNGEHRR